MESAEAALIIEHIKQVNQNVSDIRGDMRALRSDFNDKVDEVKKKVEEHEKKDQEYWNQINVRQGQLLLLKGLTFSSFGLWVLEHFKAQFGIK